MVCIIVFLLLTACGWPSPLYGISVTNGVHSIYGKGSVDVVTSDPNVGERQTYNWSATTGRLNSVSNGVHSVLYGYLANSDLVSSLQFRSNGVTRATIARRSHRK